MGEFNYILDKIMDADFQTNPFKFIYLEDFLSAEHFDIITNDSQVKTDNIENTETLMKVLQEKTYKPIPFPGCTTDINAYLDWYNGKDVAKPGHAHGLIEGFGLAFRLQEIKNNTINNLLTFFNSNEFYQTLMDKFEKPVNRSQTYVETGLQKYVSGYEISPHPDIRKKVLTYMLNVNPNENAESMGLDTDFMVFKESKRHLYDVWANEPEADRFWVPWDWCETVWKQNKNNSITIFAPDNDSLHAVRLNYDHCVTQRTQIYGNVWFNNSSVKRRPTWKDYA